MSARTSSSGTALNHTISISPDLRCGSAQALGDVIHKVLLLIRLPTQDLPEVPRLHEVVVADLGLEVDHLAGPLFMRGALLVLGRRDNLGLSAAGEIVGLCAVVASREARAITAGGIVRIERPVDGQIVEIYAQPVSLSLTVCKKADLEDWR